MALNILDLIFRAAFFRSLRLGEGQNETTALSDRSGANNKNGHVRFFFFGAR